MDDPSNRDPVLQQFRARLGDAYAGRLDRVILYGSRARGDHRPDSDYDVAVFIRSPASRWDELGRLATVTTEFLLEGRFISAKPFAAEEYWEQSPLMRDIRRDGVEL